MKAKLIDGKVIAQSIRDEVKAAVEKMVAAGRRPPSLTVVLAGKDPASQVYVNSKKKACAALGFTSGEHLLDENVTEASLVELINKLNHDPNVDGILVQLPLPKHIREQVILEKIDPAKDVDGFHPVNVGRLVANTPALRPCTPAGCIEMLKRAGVELNGAKAVVLGRSNIVGKPVATMLLHEHCTVTICHSRTRHLRDILKSADVIIAAIGKPKFVTADMVKPGAAVIDVGINRLEDKKIVGDVDFESVSKVAGFITPVPGGVGPMTIAMLMYNTLQACRMRLGE